MEMPAENIGRAMADIQKMQGSVEPLETAGDTAVLKGSVPVSKMRGYQKEFISYTKGKEMCIRDRCGISDDLCLYGKSPRGGRYGRCG